MRALQSELRAPAPEGFARLTDPQLADLAQAVAQTRRQQAAQLAAAGDQAFGHIPKLLRGPIRRILG